MKDTSPRKRGVIGFPTTMSQKQRTFTWKLGNLEATSMLQEICPSGFKMRIKALARGNQAKARVCERMRTRSVVVVLEVRSLKSVSTMNTPLSSLSLGC